VSGLASRLCRPGLVLALAGCRVPHPEAAQETCPPVAAELPPDASANGLAGEYRLHLIAESGGLRGNTADGRLHLQPYPDTLRHSIVPGLPDSSTLYPLFGAADVDLAAVGGVLSGDLASLDPMRPGVVVVEWHGVSGGPPAAGIVLRLGSDANRRDRARFDGGYMALRVRQITPDGFGGDWASGVSRRDAGGHFCAVRVSG
jgi:hypothetical protein